MRAVVISLLMALSTSLAGATELVINGGFEKNGGRGTNQFDGWTVADQPQTSGSWYVQDGTAPLPETIICSEVLVPAPPSGFTAMTNGRSGGLHILYQDVAIPAGTKATLSFQLALVSVAGFFPQPTLDPKMPSNQQFRADLIDPTAPTDTVSVLQNVYATVTGDPKRTEYVLVTRDVTTFAGRTVRLRFAVVDVTNCFAAGIDNVSIDATPTSLIDLFAASPPIVSPGRAATLSWQFHGASSGSIYDVSSGTPMLLRQVTSAGSMLLIPGSTALYTLSVDNGPADAVIVPVTGSTAAVATIARSLREASAIAIDPTTGDALVVDNGAPALLRIGSHGVITRIGAQPGGGVAVDDSGNVYVTDWIDHVIRRFDRAGNNVVLAGAATARGNSDGTGKTARFDGPSGIAVDLDGSLLVADTNNHAIRRVMPQGQVATVAALDVAPRGIAVDPGSGTVYVATDSDVRILASGARVSQTTGPIAVDRNGDLYIATNQTIVKIGRDGRSTVLAGVAGTPGGTDGSATSARFDNPTAIAVAHDGRIFIVQKTAIRELVPAAVDQVKRRSSH
jgi:hypothetical protein